MWSGCIDSHFLDRDTLAGGEWPASRPSRYTHGEKRPLSPIHLKEVGWSPKQAWADPKAGLGDMEKRKLLTVPGLEHQPLGRPACS
jgi:hypothetical protein